MSNETHFHEDTAPEVRRILEQYRRSQIRVRIWYGDTKTGIAWPEEDDVIGRIGRSIGPKKIPLLIHNSRSLYGGSILDHCIVAIADAPGRKIYHHPKLDLGNWETIGHAADNNNWCVNHNGGTHARFSTLAKAQRYRDFMTGARFAK